MSNNERSQSKRSRATERRLVPLSVWLCSDAGYGAPKAKDQPPVAEAVCERHRQAVGRELARHLIGACTRPGSVVADVFTTSETVLVAAAEMGRLGIGLARRLPVAQHLASRLRQDLAAHQRSAVRLRPHGPQALREALLGLESRVELLIAALPPYPELGRSIGPAEGSCPTCRAEQPGLGVTHLDRFLEDARHVLAPDGHLAVITTARYEHGRLVDQAPGIIQRAARAGLTYLQHVIAPRVPIEGDALVVQPGPAELPPVVSVHADVCLFARSGGGVR